MHPRFAILVALALAASVACAQPVGDRLPALGAERAPVTVSGISSGGFMAIQFHVAHSSVVKGAGVLAGGPYFCAGNSVFTAYYNCMDPSDRAPLPDSAALADVARALAASNAIDPVAHLASARVWLFSGTSDRTVSRSVVEGAAAFYRTLGVPSQHIALVADKPAGHAMVTEASGRACPVTESPFINDCDYDAAGVLLAHLLGPLAAPGNRETGRIVRFDQREFANGDAYGIGMADSGYAYVPKACESGACRIHVAFHGCRQNVQAIQEQFVREAGYNRWADANAIVVLYPQTIARSGWGLSGWRWSFVFNPRACWDWWGYTTPAYHTKAGPQIAAVKAMVDRLAAPRR